MKGVPASGVSSRFRPLALILFFLLALLRTGLEIHR
jgi:hypothetical protein